MPTHHRSASARPHSRRRPPSRVAANRTGRRPVAVSPLDDALTAAQNAPEPPARTFAEIGLPAPLVTALAADGIEAPFAIQRRSLPDALAGRDLLGRAQTGSGKTLAFGLPMLARLHAPNGTRGPRSPRGLVLVPTRELARQVADVLTPLARALHLHVTTIFGGVSLGPQISQLERGSDILVATPGRLIDLMDRGTARLGDIQVAVLDEADHMADLGFLPAVRRILDATPDGRQCLLFSATLDRGVDRLVTSYLRDPAFHAVAAAAAPVDTMEHLVFVVTSDDKVAVAAELARRPARTLFFVRTKHGADRLARQLERHDEVRAAAIHGNLNQNQRLRALDGFATGRVRVLVATDVAARGLHIDDVDLVVHYDPPNDHKDYLHRSGRTARAGATGTVLTLAHREQLGDVKAIHDAARVGATVSHVTPAHPSVVAIAESGEAVVVPDPVPVTADRPTRRAAPPRSSQRRYARPRTEPATPERVGPRRQRGRNTQSPHKPPAGSR